MSLCLCALGLLGYSAIGMTFEGAKDNTERDTYGAGVFVSTVEDGSIAQSAGVKEGMQITSINGVDSSNFNVYDLQSEIFKATDVNTLELDVRDNKSLVHSYNTKAAQQDKKYKCNGIIFGKTLYNNGADFVSFFSQEDPTVVICAVVDGENLVMVNVPLGEARDNQVPTLLEERVVDVGGKYATHMLTADIVNKEWAAAVKCNTIIEAFTKNVVEEMQARLPSLHDLLAADEDGMDMFSNLFGKVDYVRNRQQSFDLLIRDIVTLVKALGADVEDLENYVPVDSSVSMLVETTLEDGSRLSRSLSVASMASVGSYEEGQTVNHSILAETLNQSVHLAVQRETIAEEGTLPALARDGPRLSQATLERPKSPAKRPPTRTRANKTSSLATENLKTLTAAPAAEVHPATMPGLATATNLAIADTSILSFSRVFNKDSDDSVLDTSEMQQAMSNLEFLAYIRERGIDLKMTNDLEDSAKRVFECLDTNNSGGLTTNEFLQGLENIDKGKLEIRAAAVKVKATRHPKLAEFLADVEREPTDTTVTLQDLRVMLGQSEFIGFVERNNCNVTLTSKVDLDADRIMGVMDPKGTGSFTVVDLLVAMDDKKSGLGDEVSVGSSGTAVDVGASNSRMEAMSFGNFNFS